jgi:succinate dehydrogenase/fumarate reductase flavoprotein subunit
MRNGGPVTLDLRPMGKEKILTRFPQTHELARAVASLDITKEPIPIAPIAHRPMGGIETTTDGETSIKGLFAVGECACNGLNGAGRLAGNTLTEAVVFGRKVGEAAARFAKSGVKKSFPAAIVQDQEKRISALTSGNSSGDSLKEIHAELGRTMHEKTGLIRDERTLKEAREEVQRLKERYQRLGVRNASRIYNYELTAYLELGSMLNLAEAVALCAETRKESRGAHRRADFPERDDKNWRCHTLLSWEKGSPKLTQKPVSAA